MSPNRKNSLIVGRGSTAIYLALNEHLHGKEIILPCNICYAAVLPILYSGNIPHFVDITYPSGNLTYKIVKSAINQNTGAILFPYMYGNVTDEIIKIKQLCEDQHLLLIEDCASAMGGVLSNGAPVGSFGDYAIFSTGHAKNVDLDNGGILLTDLPIDNIKTTYFNLPIFNSKILEEETTFSQNYSLMRHTNQKADILKLFSNLETYRDLFLYQINDPSLITNIQNSFTVASKNKSQKLQKYQLFLQNLPREICYIYNAGSMPWRFSIFITNSKIRKAIIDTLLEANLFVSDWYPCIASSFQDNSSFENAERAEREILNFSLLDTDENIIKICDIIKSVLGERSPNEKN